MKIDFQKLGIIIAYLASNVEDLYVTKLLKLLYYIDFISYKEKESSITKDTYYKLPYGPVPTVTKNEIDAICNTTMGEDLKSQLSNFIYLESDENDFGKIVKNKKEKINLNKISKDEKKIIDFVIKNLGNKTATELSEKTHQEAPWKLSSENSVISYELARELELDDFAS